MVEITPRANDYLLWIRQDWLDKLNMKAPKTIDELEAVMEAFKNNNPDGLAPEKVTPLSVGFKTSMNTWMGDVSWIFGAYGTLPQQTTGWYLVDYMPLSDILKPIHQSNMLFYSSMICLLLMSFGVAYLFYVQVQVCLLIRQGWNNNT